MRISDWSSDVCSSDLCLESLAHRGARHAEFGGKFDLVEPGAGAQLTVHNLVGQIFTQTVGQGGFFRHARERFRRCNSDSTIAETRPAYRIFRSEEHTSELQSLMRISYAVFCLKKKKQQRTNTKTKDHAEKHKHK